MLAASYYCCVATSDSRYQRQESKMPYQTVIHSGRKLSRWIPENSTIVKEKSGLGIVYVYRVPNPRSGRPFLAVAYAGNAAKNSFHYSYKDESAVDLAIRNFFGNLKDHKERVSKRRTESYKPHTFKVGDIITNSWGYDQTNVDWYRIARTSKSYVWLQPIAGQTEQTGFMSGNSTPHVDTGSDNPEQWGFKDSKEPVEKHLASGDYVSMKYGSGRKWNGEKVYESWYH
jgi:hypothetical protein